jgi:L-lactate dehydrogenase complex protein LldG
MKTAASAKSNILKKIKQALGTPVPVPFEKTEEKELFIRTNDPELEFAENFSALQGRFSFCSNEKELAEQLQTLFAARKWSKIFLNESQLIQVLAKQGLQTPNKINLAECDVALTSCECLIARTGSIVLSSVQNGRSTSVYAPAHICIAYTNQLVFDIKDGIELLKKKYGAGIPSLITFASGPSRTADIEKTLVTGVHGPKEVFCFLVQ